jgi:hypothetical protein
MMTECVVHAAVALLIGKNITVGVPPIYSIYCSFDW